ncbi:hypothetical protein IscW_ISCW011950 [Ixodes scapularis]|uniref:Uncharacterized protein n=1 Tax=Ixodes scapularis TaxID=6945 RepID=B7QF23_IXOSC|nr:hypothetical protein IscW_ISCW011950 [Ixodes scapularis]|eukprot:XP_002414137.1 hypothetical protein IscW_ISCW011950 [Ixodes scapularis]
MWPQRHYETDLKTSVVAMASYLRHSFTLPNRKKAKYRSDLFDTRPDHSTLSKSEVTLFTGENTEGAQYYAVDRLEDAYSPTTKFPDFYGGYPLEEGFDSGQGHGFNIRYLEDDPKEAAPRVVVGVV